MATKTWTPAEFDAYLVEQRRHFLALQNRFRRRSRSAHWLTAALVTVIVGGLGSVSLWALAVQFWYITG